MSADGTVTATAVEIKSALESFAVTTAKIYISMKIVDHITEKDFVKMDVFIGDPETINSIVEAIKSIAQHI